MRSRYARTRYLRNARLRSGSLRNSVAKYLLSACADDPDAKAGINEAFKIVSDASGLPDRIIKRLMAAEISEGNPHFSDDYRQSRIMVALAQRGYSQPFVASSYEMYACHPDKVFEKITLDRKARLGREYAFWFDEAGNLRRDWFDIPDYDPTSDALPVGVLPEPPASQPDGRSRGRPKSPLRLVVSRTKVLGDDGRVRHHQEELECGHKHIEFLGENPRNRRRRCRECQAIAWETSHADLVKTSSPRRPESVTGDLHAMPKPARCTEPESVPDLPPKAAA